MRIESRFGLQQKEQVLVLNQNELIDFCGNNDEKIRLLQSHLDAKVVIRGNKLKIFGKADTVLRANNVITEILETQRETGNLKPAEFRQAVRLSLERHKPQAERTYPSAAATQRLSSQSTHEPQQYSAPNAEAPGRTPPKASEILGNMIDVPMKKARIKTLTSSQKTYVDAIRDNVVTFGIGPAGTGKTYLAMAMAASYLANNSVRRIILCRPAVEAGERLGFLPGDLSQKFDPYVRPLWDALYEMMDAEQIKRAVENGVIEVAPLAYMRGRTLSNAFVILDEGQNTTVEQMKMFLTRLGFESKAVITGDITQVDLPRGQESGLRHAHRVLSNIDGVGMINFHRSEVVRHPLLTKIIEAYEVDSEKKPQGTRPNNAFFNRVPSQQDTTASAVGVDHPPSAVNGTSGSVVGVTA
ncbi:MAG: PhoH family protein [Sumerlaeia bacterium]